MAATIADDILTEALTACDREPIHRPGAIQPHGLLLVADAATLTIVAGAGAIETRLTPDWLGQDLAALLDQDVATLLAASDGLSVVSQPVQGRAERFDVSLHRAGDHVLAELEPAAVELPWGRGTVLGWLESAVATFERAPDLTALCDRAATAFRALTGYDRVMIYRFLDDEAGRVVAEDRASDIAPFLHHHFPAADIPRQARALYIRNRTRAIPDIAYTPAPLRPAGFADLDLGDVGLRSVSPVHLAYLANMGVRASASISIVKDGVLWGLIACHHNTPRDMPCEIRAAAATLAGSLARQVRAKDEAHDYRERLRLRQVGDTLLTRLSDDVPLRQTVASLHADLQAMLGGDGLAFVENGAIDCYGVVPDPLDVRDLAAWVRTRAGIEPFATRELRTLLPEADAYRREASGLLAMPLIDDGAMLLWFRAERIEEIEWAGNPHKGTALGRDETLTPRASFESWTDTVRGRSRAWTLEEIEAAHRLRRALHEAHRGRRLRTLNAALERSLADKDALLAQKDVLMKEVDHRVQNSLQLVGSFLALQARQANDPKVAAHLTEAQARLSAVALVHRRLYRDDQIETIDLSRYLGELVDDMRTSMGAEWAAAMRVDLAPVLIPTDRAVTVGLILTELVINATKYAYGGGAGPIGISLEQHRNRFRLIVADQGRGKADAGQGFGSRMMTAMIGRLDGTIDHQDNRPGLRVVVAAPIEDRPR